MKNIKIIFPLFLLMVLTSCITSKDLRYMQPSESLTIDQEGLIPYSMQPYRVTKNDIFNLNIVTTPKGDAAQFYSRFNTSGGENSGSGGGVGVSGVGGGGNNSSDRFYFSGIKLDSQGDIHILGITQPIKAEGRTVEDIQKEIQSYVNQNFLEGKAEVRLNLDGISYYILGDSETVGITGQKKAYTQQLNIFEALANNGGLNRTVDRSNVLLLRKYPEGMKEVRLDLTREDVVNSPYFWLQNGDMLMLNTRKKSINGFGKDPIQTLTTGVSLLTTAMSIYLLITRL
ncbi:polysaccharide biosynthesis/export family protein [Daejeonia sp. YH14]|uniref:polysaccharide biosynthesis/export family protein n=1 Tax=Daejeonia sp. YH14 TaxID=3439042 RepID=UPI003F49094B